MNFTESVSTCFKKYADFNGCATRPEFWWFMAFCIAGNFVLMSVSIIFYWIFGLATLVPSLAVGARRLHDTDRSGWWQLIWLIPLIGWIVLIIWFAQEGKSENRYTVQTEALPS